MLQFITWKAQTVVHTLSWLLTKICLLSTAFLIWDWNKWGVQSLPDCQIIYSIRAKSSHVHTCTNIAHKTEIYSRYCTFGISCCIRWNCPRHESVIRYHLPAPTHFVPSLLLLSSVSYLFIRSTRFHLSPCFSVFVFLLAFCSFFLHLFIVNPNLHCLSFLLFSSIKYIKWLLLNMALNHEKR